MWPLNQLNNIAQLVFFLTSFHSIFKKKKMGWKTLSASFVLPYSKQKQQKPISSLLYKANNEINEVAHTEV